MIEGRAGHGFTIIEMLITLATLGVLLGIGATTFRPAASRMAGSALQSFVQQSRFEAIKTNRPVLVWYDAAAGRMSLAVGANASTVSCVIPASADRWLSLGDYPRVIVTANAFPIVWLPTGQPRACPLGSSPLPLGGIGIELNDGRAATTVQVGPGGEVALR